MKLLLTILASTAVVACTSKNTSPEPTRKAVKADQRSGGLNATTLNDSEADRPACDRDTLGRIVYFPSSEDDSEEEGTYWACRSISGKVAWQAITPPDESQALSLTAKNTTPGPAGPTGPQGPQGIQGIRGPAGADADVTAPVAIGSVTPNTGTFTTVTAERYVSTAPNIALGKTATTFGFNTPPTNLSNVTDGDESTSTTEAGTNAAWQFGCVEVDLGAQYDGRAEILIGLNTPASANVGGFSRMDGVNMWWGSLWQTMYPTSSVETKTWLTVPMIARYINACAQDVATGPVGFKVYEVTFYETP